MFPTLALAVVCAVAWTACLFAERLLPFDYTRSGGSWSGPTYNAWMILAYESPLVDRLDSSWYGPEASFGWGGGFPEDPPEPLVPQWGAYLSAHTNQYLNAHVRSTGVSSGWPMRAFAGGLQEIDDQAATGPASIMAHFALRLSPSAGPNILPLRPLWVGLAVNIAIYASFLWLAHSATRLLVRRFRRWLRRNHCHACGYDVRGAAQSPCPECGASRSPA